MQLVDELQSEPNSMLLDYGYYTRFVLIFRRPVGFFP